MFNLFNLISKNCFVFIFGITDFDFGYVYLSIITILICTRFPAH